MMPMAISWCFACSMITVLLDLVVTTVSSILQANNNYNCNNQQTTPNGGCQSATSGDTLRRVCNLLIAKAIVYGTVIIVSLYAKYLIDLKQRNAFLETRRSLDTRAKIERENSKQVRYINKSSNCQKCVKVAIFFFIIVVDC